MITISPRQDAWQIGQQNRFGVHPLGELACPCVGPVGDDHALDTGLAKVLRHKLYGLAGAYEQGS